MGRCCSPYVRNAGLRRPRARRVKRSHLGNLKVENLAERVAAPGSALSCSLSQFPPVRQVEKETWWSHAVVVEQAIKRGKVENLAERVAAPGSALSCSLSQFPPCEAS
jgi:hypothetical protein